MVPILDDYIQAAGIGVEAVTQGDVALRILAPATVTASPGGEAVFVARATERSSALPGVWEML